MRIAFASCMCTRVFKSQPVWEQIAAEQPDYLVLLGDSIYLDINTSVHPEEMDDDAFGQHLFALYSELLEQPQFAALVRQLPKGRVYSTWDDHDFLWNDMNGDDATGNPVQRDKVRLSTAFQEAFRETLATGLAPGSFPSTYSDPRFWHAPSQPLTTPSIKLDQNLWLHVCDVRTWRTRTFMLPEAKRTLLGDAQRAQIGAAIQAAPDAVHLIASGSTMADWKPYARDLKWLLGLAAAQRSMVLSGDIHRNEVDIFLTDGFPLHEATSSGAAVRDGVVVGKKQENFGVLDIDANMVKLYLVHNGKLQTTLSRTYDRATWLAV